MFIKSKMTSWGFAALAVFTLVGCSSSDQPDTGEVFGVVTLNGTPIEAALIEFRPKSGGRSSIAHTDANGAYELRYNANTPGAKVDVHTVSISYSRDPMIDDNGKVTEKGVAEKFPKEYTDGSMEREVKPGKNEFNFDATSGK